jgi:hypothetical protein
MYFFCACVYCVRDADVVSRAAHWIAENFFVHKIKEKVICVFLWRRKNVKIAIFFLFLKAGSMADASGDTISIKPNKNRKYMSL